MNAKPNKGRFIAMPIFAQLKRRNLKYIDALTYVTIRSFNNSENNSCYPSYETIAKKAGMCRTSIIASVKRLENAGLLKIQRSTRKHICNQYDFSEKLGYFDRVPCEIFDCDLTAHQKAMLLCLRSICLQGLLQMTFPIKKISELLEVSYRTVHAQLKPLVTKGYITEKHISYGGKNKGDIWLYLSEKLDWKYDYTKAAPIKKSNKIKLRVA